MTAMKLFSKVGIYICIQNLSTGDILLAWGFYNYYPAGYFISHTTIPRDTLAML